MATPTRAEKYDQGKALREKVSRSRHGDWSPATNRVDPLERLQASDRDRLPHLIPIKYGRMVESPFAYFRGSAGVMAADLAPTPVSGINAMLCGDAHLCNFGVFATPERNLIFDINDFDEVYPGPWEWDVKRLAASGVLAGRSNGCKDADNRDLAKAVGRAYQKAMQYFDDHTTLEMWYYHIDAEYMLDLFKDASSKRGQKTAQEMVEKARQRTQAQTLEKLTTQADGRRRFISEPPLLVPLRADTYHEVLGDFDRSPDELRATIEANWHGYLGSLSKERQFLLSRYRIADGALRVGGIGSVGTRCLIVLLEGQGGEDDALILQLKEAGASVLEPFLPAHTYDTHAERVVTGQTLMQTVSDIFLGWHRSSRTEVDYYWRQLKDMKGSVEVADLDDKGLETYLELCSWTLARAHARTGDAATTCGYIGKSDKFAEAIAQFAIAYADQIERDYEQLAQAVQSGKIPAERGI
ncbi:DUF2252 domain-containing protein [Leptolyngbya iicbica]|uniref:DUF2252 domain-containing protein n=2 Tax=Cyanophyceae TaxID=3028117 RepID=A0A4V2E3E5_9CYAN|nr:DUF2252 domain-containing protein [Leptolyngbya sp. LK]RZM82160.1 DUF2252 domain-containing protein [Leptolyngbya sp. LK]